MTTANDAAFSRKAAPVPSVETMRPPIAGPTARAPFTAAEPSAIAAGSSGRGTSSVWIACHAGAVRADPMPRAKVKPSRLDGASRPANARPARAPATNSIQAWLAISSRRRSTTSARAPAGRANRTRGRLAAVCTSAVMPGEGESEVMSHTAATPCTQVPT